MGEALRVGFDGLLKLEFHGCACLRRCHDDSNDGRNSRRTRRGRGGSVRIGNRGLYAGR